MNVVERFLKYVKINTQCQPGSGTIPTSKDQFILANELEKELQEMGITVTVTKHCHVYASIEATKGYEDKKSIGFIAHMDTSPDFSGENVNVQIVENYDGKDLKLGDSGKILSVSQFPHLKDYVGRTLITTDGTTLLGADDKAGVAEIMALAKILKEENIPHGKVCFGFTPDEEGGDGVEQFDVEAFGAEFAYTCDGSTEGEIEYENFNASGAKVKIKGFNVHPGTAKDTMVNAALVAMEFNSMLPSCQTPRDTQGYEGFYHLTKMSGDGSNAELSYIIRDHNLEFLNAKKSTMLHIEKVLNEKYGENTVAVEITDGYRNMIEKILPHMHLINNAEKAIKMAGLTPETKAIRGGTDGARLSYVGLPCPNLGTAGQAYHGPYEHITTQGMEKCVEILVNIVKLYAE